MNEQKQQGGQPPLRADASELTRISNLQEELERVKRHCQVLERGIAHLEFFTDSIPDHAFVVLDAEGTVVRWNEGAERVMGWPAHEIVGRSFDCSYPGEETECGIPKAGRTRAVSAGTDRAPGAAVRCLQYARRPETCWALSRWSGT